jgi:hypothetical protein
MEINKSYTTEEYQFQAFKSLMDDVCENGMLNEFSIPTFLSKQYNFIKELASKIAINIKDIAKIFMNRVVFNFFSKIKWSVEYIFDLAKKGLGVYRDILGAISEYISKTKVGKWTEDKLRDLDNWLKNHPKIKRITGVAVAGLLIYIWFNMSFTGDFKYDFDMVDVFKALSGSFSLSQLFAGKDGIKLLLLFTTGVIGVSFPWPGPTSVKFLFSLVKSLANWVGVRLQKEGKKPYSEIRSENNLHRVFKPNVDNSELVWHRDKEDRLVEVVSGKGWMLQLDNQIPIELMPGDVLKIKKETYHRVIRGNTPLKVIIKLLD